MASSLQFNEVLRQWTEVFMGRSMRDFSAFMRKSGLSMPQVSALYRLYYRGQCGVTDIAGHLDVSSAAASQMIERLVQQGLLERNEDPTDRRAKQIALSPDGRELMQESIEARVRWMAELTTVLSPEEQDTIVAALDALTSAAIRLDPYSQAHETGAVTA
ncbi:MAG TPA: MarR family transcriptional regulator [Anaerolineae bacterium]|nr:MarR family transcriptional regulator [Anaerolineae bacterium]